MKQLRTSLGLFALFAFILIPLELFAAGTSTAVLPAADKPAGTFTQLGLSLWEMLAPVFAALLAWIAKGVQAFITAKVQNATVAGALTRLDWAVINAVKAVQQTLVEAIKAAKDPNSPGGVSITELEAAEIKAKAIAAAKSFLGRRGIDELLAVFGIGESQLDGLIGDRVESAVHDLRANASSPR